MKKNITRLKANIEPEQYKLLLNSLKGNSQIRAVRKDRLLKIFVTIYNLGIRLNECSQFSNAMMNELLNTGKLIITSHKQGSEKMVYITSNGAKEIKKIFGAIPNDDKLIFVSERGSKTSPMNPIAMINDVNSYLKTVFGADTRIKSHSFRQTLISNLATSGVNTKIIQNLVGHKSINTTYRYITTKSSDITKALELVR